MLHPDPLILGPQQLPEPLASVPGAGKRERGSWLPITACGIQPVARITPASPSPKCSHPWGGTQQPPAFHHLLRGEFPSFLPFSPFPEPASLLAGRGRPWLSCLKKFMTVLTPWEKSRIDGVIEHINQSVLQSEQRCSLGRIYMMVTFVTS